MDSMIYTAMSGASRALEQQGVITNNLANVSTTGFREQLSMARAVPLQGRSGELSTRVSVVAATSGTLMRQGILAETGRALDVAVRGDGWLAVQTPDGEAYTRAGALNINADGVLVTAAGLPVLSEDDAPIDLPERGSVTFTEDGTINALGAGDNLRDIQVVGQLKRVNPDPAELERGDDGLFRMRDGGAAPADAEVGIVSGFLEKSNVDPAHALVSLIANARHFELQMKAIQDASGNAERANSILSIAG